MALHEPLAIPLKGCHDMEPRVGLGTGLLDGFETTVFLNGSFETALNWLAPTYHVKLVSVHVSIDYVLHICT